MTQSTSSWQKFNPRTNRSRFLWLLLGVVSFVLSIIGITFAILEHRSPPGVLGTTVKIDINSDESSDNDSSSIRVVWAFDSKNNVLGSSYLDTVFDSSGTNDIQVQQYLNRTAEGKYIDVIAGEDELCITAISTTSPNGEKRQWFGDVGAACGQAWEYSGRAYSTSNGSAFHAKCVWMSTSGFRNPTHNGPKSIVLKQMKIDVMAYGHDVGPDQITNNLGLYCGATVFCEEDRNPIVGVPGFAANPPDILENPQTRSLTDFGRRRHLPRSRKSAERLIISSSHHHSAVELCESPTSRGSDFVSMIEGMFCDMETKTLYSLCGGNVNTECFDAGSHELKSRRKDEAVRRRYQRVSRWD